MNSNVERRKRTSFRHTDTITSHREKRVPTRKLDKAEYSRRPKESRPMVFFASFSPYNCGVENSRSDPRDEKCGRNCEENERRSQNSVQLSVISCNLRGMVRSRFACDVHDDESRRGNDRDLVISHSVWFLLLNVRGCSFALT